MVDYRIIKFVHCAVLGLVSWLCVFSCAKPFLNSGVDLTTGNGELVELLVEISNAGDATKAAGVADDAGVEEAVRRWACFLFDDESEYFIYGVSTSKTGIPVTVRAGRSYTCFALVNYPTSGAGAFNPAGIASRSDLTGKVAYLSDNSFGSLLMYGTKTIIPKKKEYDPETYDSVTNSVVPESVFVNVTRLVSRIDIASIRVDFSGKPAFAGKPFVLRSIYVTNAYRTSRYGSDFLAREISASRSAWYNGAGWHNGDSPDSGMDALLGDININRTIADGGSYSTKYSFYPFPNPVVVDSRIVLTGYWDQRCTRLIVEGSIDGIVYYYPFDIPGMQRNYIYAVNELVILGAGSSDPEVLDFPPDSYNCTFTIDARDWDTTVNIFENS